MNISNIIEINSKNLKGFQFTYGTIYGGSMTCIVENEFIIQTMKSLYSNETFLGEKRTGLCDFEEVEISLNDYAIDLFSGFDVNQKAFILNSLLDSYKEFEVETKSEFLHELNENFYRYLSQSKAQKITNEILSTINKIIK